jgi:hypothetical protein
LDFQDHNNYHLRHILAGLKVEEVKVEEVKVEEVKVEEVKVEEVKVEEMMRVLHYNHNIL